MSEVLLDTCAVIWTGGGSEISDAARDRLNEARLGGERTHVSPFTAWELGILVSRGRLRLTRAPADWFEDYVARGEMSLAPLSARILAESSQLPGEPPGDPADRVIIATARSENLTIVTRDRLILRYAAEGHVRAMAC
ncbi:type II toxin-antitoxin system VapC family toxin [Vannielia litorea]|uniref:PIN domain nuclease, a component of toxin-antitoxin system (PIN domain) n=1 Tax=Vannielia litorea TaxID=1217970 RepID=A0A1N6GB42_9RHOB|nr:type II toxin-antitoxin system VapC family toxin [Vannielia litorea]SIO04769.1 PIN domain nuclease, a component of toxin-antitoxin system (PIN domain) [Vannielia litorea]